jgi:hypothetical protein
MGGVAVSRESLSGGRYAPSKVKAGGPGLGKPYLSLACARVCPSLRLGVRLVRFVGSPLGRKNRASRDLGRFSKRFGWVAARSACKPLTEVAFAL